MTFSYGPLSIADSIRLLHIAPGHGNIPISTRLATYQLEDHCSYDALSYVWGESVVTETLLVNQQEFNVSKSLHTILLHLRLPEETRSVWIDAICINQQDSIEKSQQVALMGKIYREANDVLCWLGKLTTHRLWALRFLQTLAEDSSKYIKPDRLEYQWTLALLNDELLPDVDVDGIVAAASEAHVEAVYQSDWFTRLW